MERVLPSSGITVSIRNSEMLLLKKRFSLWHWQISNVDSVTSPTINLDNRRVRDPIIINILIDIRVHAVQWLLEDIITDETKKGWDTILAG